MDNIPNGLKEVFAQRNKEMYAELEASSKQRRIDAMPLFFLESKTEGEYDFEVFYSVHPQIKSYNKMHPLADQHYMWDVEDILKVQFAIYILRNELHTMDESANIWQRHSQNLCASWLYVPNDPDTIIKCIESDDFFINYQDSSQS